MKTRIARLIGIGALAAAFPLIVGAATAGAGTSEEQTVALGGATSARVRIEMADGRLTLMGAAADANLMEADFRYDDDDRSPEVAYRVEGTEGQLTVDQGDGDRGFWRWPWEDDDSAWDLRFNGAVPTDLVVQLGAGVGDLDLSALDVGDLEVELGAGEATIDLTGPRRRDVRAAIEAGAGNLTVRLPRDVGVRIEAETGLGDVEAVGLVKEGDAYVNDAYATAPVTIDLDLELGAGNVRLEVVE